MEAALHALTTFPNEDSCRSTMSTVEIAELTGKRHDNVMRSARDLKERGIIVSPQIEEVFHNGLGGAQKRSAFHLNKVESINLVSRLSQEYMSAIISRWLELEEASKSPRVSDLTRRDLGLMIASEAERADRAEAKVAELAPKAEVHDMVSSTDGLVSVQHALKLGGGSPNKDQHKLIEAKLRFKGDDGKLQPYQTAVEQGLFRMRLRPVGEKSYPQTMVTPKGVQRIARLLSEGAA